MGPVEIKDSAGGKLRYLLRASCAKRLLPDIGHVRFGEKVLQRLAVWRPAQRGFAKNPRWRVEDLINSLLIYRNHRQLGCGRIWKVHVVWKGQELTVGGGLHAPADQPGDLADGG